MPPLGASLFKIIAQVTENIKERIVSTALSFATGLTPELGNWIARRMLVDMQDSFETIRTYTNMQWTYEYFNVDPESITVANNQMIAADAVLIGPDGRQYHLEVRMPWGRKFNWEDYNRRLAATIAEEWKKRGLETGYWASQYVQEARGIAANFYLVTHAPRTA